MRSTRCTWPGTSCRASPARRRRADDTVEHHRRDRGLPVGRASTLDNAGRTTSVPSRATRSSARARSCRPAMPAPAAADDRPALRRRPDDPGPGRLLLRRSDSFLLLLAVNTWERQTHANAPASFEWDIDTDRDGEADFAVFNLDLAGDLTDGRNVVVRSRTRDRRRHDLLPHRSRDEQRQHRCSRVRRADRPHAARLRHADHGRPARGGHLLHRSRHRHDHRDGVRAAGRALLPGGRRRRLRGRRGAGRRVGRAQRHSTSVPDGHEPERDRRCCSSPTAPFAAKAGVFPKTGSPQANEALAVRVTVGSAVHDIADAVRGRHRLGVRERHHRPAARPIRRCSARTTW